MSATPKRWCRCAGHDALPAEVERGHAGWVLHKADAKLLLAALVELTLASFQIHTLTRKKGLENPVSP
jgi:hypothetical protein